jgi:hypothetical protein
MWLLLQCLYFLVSSWPCALNQSCMSLDSPLARGCISTFGHIVGQKDDSPEIRMWITIFKTSWFVYTFRKGTQNNYYLFISPDFLKMGHFISNTSYFEYQRGVISMKMKIVSISWIKKRWHKLLATHQLLSI